MSVLAKWYAAVVVGLLHKEPEPIEWKELHVGAERSTNCEQMQALLTNIFCRDIGCGRKIDELLGFCGSSSVGLRGRKDGICRDQAFR